jgi:NADPH:quinone reductase-like Zn-dependent oxidoreductase
MKAVVYEKKQLVYCDVPMPNAKENEVLVKICAASVNALDYRSMRMGIVPKNKIFGADIAGVVEAVGISVKDYCPGDRVAAEISGCGLGGFAEFVAVPEGVLVKMPDAVSFEDAAALPVAAETAMQALRDKGGIEKGQSVLIVGAGGGVGTYAVQLAKHFGAQVTAVCGSKNVDMVKSIGADNVIDYTKERFDTRKAQYDIVVAANGTYPLSAYKRVLKQKGICVVLGGALRQIFKTMVFGPFLSIGGKKIRMLAAKPSPKDLAFHMALVEQGRLRPVIDARYPLSETAQAIDYLGRGHARGKVIITIQEG